MKNFMYCRFAAGWAAAVLLLIPVFFIQDACASASNAVEAVGTAVIRNRNLAKAKEEALTAALTAGVDQVVMKFFSTDALSQNFQKYNETVLGHAADFVENYQVLAEGASGKQYRILLRVTVSADMLKQKFPDFAMKDFPVETEKPAGTVPEEFPSEAEKPAGTVPEEFPAEAEKPVGTVPEEFPAETEKPAGTVPEAIPKPSFEQTEEPAEMAGRETPEQSQGKREGPPKILFLIAEQDLQDMDPSFWWGEKIGNQECYTENAMRDAMESAGFQNIAHGSGLPETEKLSHLLLEPDIENADAAAAGRQMKADVVIAGKAIVYKVQDDTDAEEEGKVPSFNATLTVRAILAENGMEIASLLETAVLKQSEGNQSGEQSLMTAGTEAAEKLIPKIGSIWNSAKELGDSLELTVKGTRNLGNFVRFRKALNAMPDVTDIQIQAVKSDEAEIRIAFSRDAQAFAEAAKQLKFDSFGVEIRVISGRHLEIALVPK